jgi:hypothetical protein
MFCTWTEEETKILIDNYAISTNEDMRLLLPNKTDLAIYKKAYKIGLKRTKEIEFLNRSSAKKGEKCNFWKGGVCKTSQGYIAVKMPSHHRADKHGYVLEHILIFEKETGIKVPKSCCVHHLNGNKSDNRIENLCLMSFSAHTKHHHIGAKRTQETKQKLSEMRKKRCLI